MSIYFWFQFALLIAFLFISAPLRAAVCSWVCSPASV